MRIDLDDDQLEVIKASLILAIHHWQDGILALLGEMNLKEYEKQVVVAQELKSKLDNIEPDF